MSDMPTLTNPAQRDALIARVERLSPEAKGRWGSMTAPEMLAHCADALRMGLGDLPCTPKNAPLARLAVTKWLFLNVIPFPKNAPTAKELRSRAPKPWNDERADLVALIRRVGSAGETYPWAAHPLFGTLSGAQWGQLAHKHLDHHLRQFGG
jgi:hypothetical protein